MQFLHDAMELKQICQLLSGVVITKYAMQMRSLGTDTTAIPYFGKQL